MEFASQPKISSKYCRLVRTPLVDVGGVCVGNGRAIGAVPAIVFTRPRPQHAQIAEAVHKDHSGLQFGQHRLGRRRDVNNCHVSVSTVKLGQLRRKCASLNGMAQQVFNVQSALSVREAFDRCIDLRRVNEWDRGVTAPRRLTGEGQAVGSTYEVTVTGFDGKPSAVVYKLLEVDAPHRFVMEGVNDVLRAYDILTFTSNDAGCELHYDAQLELLGEQPPMTDAELEALFARVAAVPQRGLSTFLNP